MIPLLSAWASTAAAGSLLVTVNGSAGSPIPATEIFVINQFLASARAQSNSDGSHQFNNLPNGSYRVWAVPGDGDEHTPRYHPSAIQYCDGELVTVSDGLTAVEMTLPIGESLSGTVLNELEAPVSGVRIRAQSTTSNATRDGWTGNDGEFWIGGLEPNEEWWLQAAISGHPVQWWGGTVEQSESPPISPLENPEIAPWILIEGLTVTGTISSPYGAVENASVRVYSNGQVVQSTTDASGQYNAHGVPTGDMTAWAAADGLAVTYLGDSDRPDEFIALTENGATAAAVDIDMPTEATLPIHLMGTAPLTEGELRGISVVLYNDTRTVGRGEQTDDSGTAVFTALHGGLYEAFIYGADVGHADDWYRDETGSIIQIEVLAESANAPIQVDLTPSHTVHGAVLDEWGKPIQGASIIITETIETDTGTADSAGLFIESTDSDGEFVVSGLPDGDWNIRVQTSAFCPNDPGHVAVYWPNEVDPLMADTIALGARDNSITELQFVMPDDHDHDSMGDRWERRYGLNTSLDDSMEDPDRDGLNNLTEYRMRTNPLEAAGYWTIERKCGCTTAMATQLAGWAVPLLALAVFRRRESTLRHKSVHHGQ